jgi:acylphosphatase
MLTWCRHGPPSARVDDVHVEEEPATGESQGFAIRW